MRGYDLRRRATDRTGDALREMLTGHFLTDRERSRAVPQGRETTAGRRFMWPPLYVLGAPARQIVGRRIRAGFGEGARRRRVAVEQIPQQADRIRYV